MNNIQKAAVIGCGFVGSSIAFTLMQSGIFSELVLIDANRDKAEGEAMDLSHGLPFTHPMDIRAGDYDDVADCALVIVTAGAGQKPGETRLLSFRRPYFKKIVRKAKILFTFDVACAKLTLKVMQIPQQIHARKDDRFGVELQN
mgnify:CR=1 FL=1